MMNSVICMKIFTKSALFIMMSLILCTSFSACSKSGSDLAGTYELNSIEGTLNGVPISDNIYSYFRIILDENGNGTIQSKVLGVSGSGYEAKGTYRYERGKIIMTITYNGQTSTETYSYSNGKITYIVDNDAMKFTIILKKK